MTHFDDEFAVKAPAAKKATADDFPNAVAIRHEFEAVFGPVTLIYAKENGKEINTKLNRAIEQMQQMTVDQWFEIEAASKSNEKFVRGKGK